MHPELKYIGSVLGRDTVGNVVVLSPRLQGKVILTETGSTRLIEQGQRIFDEYFPGRKIVFSVRERSNSCYLGTFVRSAYGGETEEVANHPSNLCRAVYDPPHRVALFVGFWDHAFQFFSGEHIRAGVFNRHKYALLEDCPESAFYARANGAPIEIRASSRDARGSLLREVTSLTPQAKDHELSHLAFSRHSNCSI